MLNVYRNDVIDWVIAESPEDCDAVMREHMGELPDDPFEWSLLAVDKVLSVHTDDGRGTVVQTAAKWIAEQGRSFLASTEY